MSIEELLNFINKILNDWDKLADEEKEGWYCGNGTFGFIEKYDEFKIIQNDCKLNNVTLLLIMISKIMVGDERV